jgi:hypothetical protein
MGRINLYENFLGEFIEEKEMAGRSVSRKGFGIPRWLAWVMVFAGIIIFLIGIPFLLYNLFLWSYLRRFDATGIAMMVVGVIVAYIGYKNTGFILRREEIIDRWSVLIENGKGRADDIFNDTKDFIKKSEAPRLSVERKKIAPTIAKDILGIRRSFLVVTNFENPKLINYKTFICARDYGNNLDVSWYLTYKMGLLEALLNLFFRGRFVPKLDLFDEQDLRAYVTNAHHSLLKAVENLMLDLKQDPSAIDRKSKGFLGVS